jgi:hypothetical protein
MCCEKVMPKQSFPKALIGNPEEFDWTPIKTLGGDSFTTSTDRYFLIAISCRGKISFISPPFCNYHYSNTPFLYPRSWRKSPKLSNTGRSVTEKMIAGSFPDLFLN